MIQPPTRLVSDAIYFQHDDLSSTGHEAQLAVCVATIGLHPGAKEVTSIHIRSRRLIFSQDLFSHLKATPVYTAGSAWMGAVSQRSSNHVTLFIAYKSFKAAYNATEVGRQFLESLAPHCQQKAHGFAIHEFARFFAK